MKVKNEDDIIAFQSDLDIYYEWASKNNMEFNSSKFVTLRYGKDSEIKDDYIYFTNDWINPIEALEHHKDLGVQMSDTGGFNFHIENTIKKAKKKIG